MRTPLLSSSEINPYCSYFRKCPNTVSPILLPTQQNSSPTAYLPLTSKSPLIISEITRHKCQPPLLHSVKESSIDSARLSTPTSRLPSQDQDITSNIPHQTWQQVMMIPLSPPFPLPVLLPQSSTSSSAVQSIPLSKRSQDRPSSI